MNEGGGGFPKDEQNKYRFMQIWHWHIGNGVVEARKARPRKARPRNTQDVCVKVLKPL